MDMGKILFYFTAFVLGFIQATDACGGSITNGTGLIQSPNFGDEWGKEANCDWEFDLSGGRALKLTLTVMKMYYYDLNGINCPSFIFGLNVNAGGVSCRITPPTIYSYYSNPACSTVDCGEGCPGTLISGSDSVPVKYYNDGRTPNPNPGAGRDMHGFKMEYEFVDCPEESTTTASPTTTPASPTTTPEITTKEQQLTTTMAPKHQGNASVISTTVAAPATDPNSTEKLTATTRTSTTSAGISKLKSSALSLAIRSAIAIIICQSWF